MVGGRVLAVAPPCLWNGGDIHTLNEMDADFLIPGITDSSLYTVLAWFPGLPRYPFPSALPSFFHSFSIRTHDDGPDHGLVVAGMFKNFVLSMFLVPFHGRNAHGVIVADENRVMRFPPIRPHTVGSGAEEIAPSIPAAVIGQGISERSGKGVIKQPDYHSSQRNHAAVRHRRGSQRDHVRAGRRDIAAHFVPHKAFSRESCSPSSGPPRLPPWPERHAPWCVSQSLRPRRKSRVQWRFPRDPPIAWTRRADARGSRISCGGDCAASIPWSHTVRGQRWPSSGGQRGISVGAFPSRSLRPRGPGNWAFSPP